jgi:hypothetical protein
MSDKKTELPEANRPMAHPHQFTETVTTENGAEKKVVASSQAELDEAVKAAKAEKAPTFVDINVPLQKGHDLLRVEGDAVTQGATDGTGAHNSPNQAIKADGSVEGSEPMLVNTADGNVEEVVGSGETKVTKAAKEAADAPADQK